MKSGVRLDRRTAAALAVALACAVGAGGPLSQAGANRPAGAEFKNAAEKKTIKTVKNRLPRDRTPGLAPSHVPVKVKVTSCKQRLAGHRVVAFKCAWNAHGELPGRVLLRCNGKATFVVASKKVKRRGTKCKNLEELQAPLLATPHDVEFGYFEDFSTIGDLWDDAAAGGARIIREGIIWRDLQPTPSRDTSTWNWSDADRVYAAALASGLRPVFTIRNAPCWASPQPCDPGAPTAIDPAYIGDFANAAAEVAKRYPQAYAIEVWFEPNSSIYWGATPDPATFSALVKAAADAVHATGTGIPVWTGGLAPGVAADVKYDYPVFIRQAFDAGGIASADAIGFHAVTEVPFKPGDDPTQGYLGRLRIQIRHLQDAAAEHGFSIPVVLTQLSYSSGPGEYTEAEQAEALVSSYEVTKRIAGVTNVIVSRLLDSGEGTKVSGFGVLRSDRSRKPAYCQLAAARAVPTPPGC